MAYNDVAWDDENPHQGKLFNQMHGKDVYAGCKIDYHAGEVNRDNFMAILKGDVKSLNVSDSSNSTRKVLQSDQNSKVFLYFSDHGSPGFLLFPETHIYADELNSTINFMYENQMYSEMLIFLEACESGSMFHNVDLAKMNTWALTATNATDPSYGTYCYPHDLIGDGDDDHLYTCLGDLFSISWMEYLEKNEHAL